MRLLPNFFVFSSPLDREENEPKSCFIALNIHEGITDFVDHIEQDTLLSAVSYTKKEDFFFTFDHYYSCYLVEVHLKETDSMQVLSCEQVAIAETYSYLSQRTVKDK